MWGYVDEQGQLHAATTTAPSEEESDVKENIPGDDYNLLCNCYAYVDANTQGLPSSRIILGNLSANGEVAVFYYPSSGVYHYALVRERTDGLITIDETNYRHCQYSRRVIPEDYPYLLGFYQFS